MKHLIHLVYIMCLTVLACQPKENPYDASGTFEAVETIISSEVGGRILQFDIEEGDELRAGQTIGLIDTMTLFLRKQQLLAQISVIGSRNPDVEAQTSFYDEQLRLVDTTLNHLIAEQARLKKLVDGQAAPSKGLDDIEAKISEARQQKQVIVHQKAAQVSALNTRSAGLKKEPLPLRAQIDQINEEITKCQLTSPVKGTVLAKYVQVHEVAAPGKPLYKIADLSEMDLRAYITGDQLSSIRLNQEVQVMSDDGSGGLHAEAGHIIWINDKSEFTPKTIQTKDERANLVYAIKIRLHNDGRYKIGMYGEINL